MFFRPATKDDFTGYDIQYDHFRYMSDEVKALIEKDDDRSALQQFRSETGRGFNELKKYCEEYKKYISAKRDFEDGKQVFVSY